MVIMVLLKLALTWATPAVMFLRSRLRRRCGAWAINSQFLLPFALSSSKGCRAFETRHPAEKCLATIPRMVARLFLLAGDRPRFPFPGTGVGVGALAADRQAPAVAEPAIAGE